MARRYLIAVLIVLGAPPAARAQLGNHVNLDKLNCKLGGQVVDYTHNHGADRRICSTILGQPRDLYVYLPPGYSPCNAYPMLLYLHMGYVDEHDLIAVHRIAELDGMIQRGEFPPVVVVAPDGIYTGENRTRDPHSLFVNGCGGRMEDHLMCEVVPFVTAQYSIRPEREAHAILGVSAGGFGALGLAIKRRDYFAAVGTLAPPSNLRYDNSQGNYRADFDPTTYRWKTVYNPDEVVGVFYCGLQRVPARKYLDPVFGCEPDVVGAITRANPADLLFTTDLQPGQLAIYINYPGRDNWNFDAQAESFGWLAAGRGVEVTLDRDPHGKHNLRYFKTNVGKAFVWLGGHLLPPVPVGTPPAGPAPTVSAAPNAEATPPRR